MSALGFFSFPGLSRLDKRAIIDSVKTCGHCSADGNFICLMNEDVYKHLEWLHELYFSTVFVDHISDIAGSKLQPIDNSNESLNVFLLKRGTAWYPEHSYMVMAFITTHDMGGSFIFKHNNENIVFRANSGSAVVFGGEQDFQVSEVWGEDRIILTMGFSGSRRLTA